MSMVDLVTGSRLEVQELAGDARIARAEEALRRFARSGSVREAAAFAEAGLALVREIIEEEFPPELAREAKGLAAAKLVSAAATATLAPAGGGLAWSLAHEMRSLAASYGREVESVRPVRRDLGAPGAGQVLDSGLLWILAAEVFRRARSGDSLRQIQQILGMSNREVAELFGVTRQAVDQWHAHGLPRERVAEVGRIREVAEVLHDELIPERIPGIVRTPARGLGGRTILEVLREPGGADAVFGYLAGLYSFASP